MRLVGVIGLVFAAAVAGQSAPARRAAAPPAARPSMARVEAMLNEIEANVWARGDVYWHAGRYEDRIRTDYFVTAMNPRAIEAYETGGWLLESVGRPDEALALYKRARVNNPKDPFPPETIGYFLYNKRRYKEAVPYYEESVRKNAGLRTWKMLAHAYERSGNARKSLATWEQVVKRWPNDPPAKSNLERVRRKVAQQ
jgi:tetratricopeptide (TPR) repeat protein